MTCSAPADCAEIERRHAGHGLLARRRREPRQPALGRGRPRDPHGQPDGRREEGEPGLPRVPRQRLQRHARPRARSSGRSCSSCSAARRAKRRDVRPRGHRGGNYPLLRGAMCVFVRDLIVYGVLQDMMKGRPGDLRDVLELRRGRPPLGPRARRHARGAAQARPAVRPDRAGPPLRAAAVRDRRPLRPRPDPGRDLQAAQRLRARRPRRALALTRAASRTSPAATSRTRWSATRSARRPAAKPDEKREKNDVSDHDVVVLGSGNLGLVYLMEERRRLTLEEIERAPPRPDPGAARAPARRLAARPLVRARAGRARRQRRRATSPTARVEGDDPLAPFSPNAPQHLLRTDGFAHVADIMVGSFYDAGARRGLRVRGADLVPRRHRRPADAAVHPPSRRARAARRGARRGGRRPRDPARLEARPQRSCIARGGGRR